MVHQIKPPCESSAGYEKTCANDSRFLGKLLFRLTLLNVSLAISNSRGLIACQFHVHEVSQSNCRDLRCPQPQRSAVSLGRTPMLDTGSHVNRRSSLPRALFLLHRYLGIAVGALMVTWCVSGVVMMYVSYPALEEGTRLKAL